MNIQLRSMFIWSRMRNCSLRQTLGLITMFFFIPVNNLLVTMAFVNILIKQKGMNKIDITTNGIIGLVSYRHCKRCIELLYIVKGL